MCRQSGYRVPMTTDQILLFALFAAVFALLLWGRWRYDLVAFAALLVAVFLGLVPERTAFEGFGHPATIIVALVLVVSAGLVRSGVVQLITRKLIDPSRPLPLHIAILGGVGAVISAFMNNVAALALLMPVDVETAKKAGRSPRATLMALSFATILGGMATMIGTPPNIIIASIRAEALGTPYAMFDFTPVGGLTALAGLLFIALAGWRLIPKAAEETRPDEALALYIAELKVPDGSDLAGRSLTALEEAAEKADVVILGLRRDRRRIPASRQRQRIAPGDVLLIEGRPEAIDEFRGALGLDFEAPPHRERPGSEGTAGLGLVEAVVPADARIAGRSARRIGLAWRKGAVLLGIARHGKRVKGRIREETIRPGDLLLLVIPEAREEEVLDWLGVLPLAGRRTPVTRNELAPVSVAIFTAGVLAASFGITSMAVALGMVVVAYALLRIVPLGELYNHVEWPVVVLLGAMIPLGGALEDVGGTELIARGLVALASGQPPWVALLLLMVVTMSLSDVLNNTATTIVAAPVGIEMARLSGLSPDPFLMGVAVAASCAFLTPIGHKNNTLILGPGGYRFGDYWRMGLPLELLVLTVSLPLILLFWWS